MRTAVIRPEAVFLLGKPPREQTIFPEIFGRLRRAGIAVHVISSNASTGQYPWPSSSEALVVHRGLGPELVAKLVQYEDRGWRFCNPARASLLVQQRPSLVHRLSAAGLPVPRSRVVEHWHDVRRACQGGSTVIKAADGSRGRGTGVQFCKGGEPSSEPPFHGPYLLEDFAKNDGWDRKLYVVGACCRGLLKQSKRGVDGPARALDPHPELKALALAAGRALGLEIYGIDIVVGPDGPVIVDVNLFPSFKAIPGAAELVADHLTGLARAHAAKGRCPRGQGGRRGGR